MTNPTIDRNGDKFWRNAAGKLHRENGPAYKSANGNKSWYINGQLHRTDGPAIEYANGSTEYYINNKLHREDGPACEFVAGYKFWFIDGTDLTKHQFDTYVKSIINILNINYE